MLNDLSLSQKKRRLCVEELAFQLDNAAANYNASITKKYLIEKKKTSWPLSMLFRPQSYRKFVGIDCCKSLWRNLTVVSNFWTQKRNHRRMEKIPSVQFQELVDGMHSHIFKVIKANGGTKNIFEKYASIF